MTRTIQLPDVRRILDGLERRVGILERRQRPEPSTAVENEIIFSFPDLVAVSTSPKAYLQTSATLRSVVCSLGTAGSSTTTVQVKKNGTTVVTINLTSSDTFERAAAATAYVADTDYLTVAVSAAGTAAEDLTVQCRFS